MKLLTGRCVGLKGKRKKEEGKGESRVRKSGSINQPTIRQDQA
jgi:hypothetical protein